ncbi:hypothetical protein [Pontibacter anaerobius]|uniref:Lipoprotein n=1 Tax=Pontibacter anaerobius TaxID=2993940 RepID=A0ABT3RK23_9BACT|nr:hypothetical protein [Pontibacter anaerobius]MCX2742202.1 hypothetical protein [Pontibacter anaerobius]
MKKNLIYFALVALLFACDNAFEDRAFEKQSVVYHVIKAPLIDTSNSTPPSPPLLYYGQHNFIVYPNGKTYYHNKFNNYGWCGTGIDTSNPDFVSLQPSDLMELTDDNLVQFVKSVVQDTSSYHRKIAATISSPVDSITNKHFNEIINVFSQKNFNIYSVRKTTEEEQVVLSHKIENKEYDPDQINWKGEFGGIKFLPPNSKE